jgi:hypothetical protein
MLVLTLACGALAAVIQGNDPEVRARVAQHEKEREAREAAHTATVEALPSAAADVVRSLGWKCDTISYFSADRMDAEMLAHLNKEFTLKCNDRRYTYTLRDVGGHWTVRPE